MNPVVSGLLAHLGGAAFAFCSLTEVVSIGENLPTRPPCPERDPGAPGLLRVEGRQGVSGAFYVAFETGALEQTVEVGADVSASVVHVRAEVTASGASGAPEGRVSEGDA